MLVLLGLPPTLWGSYSMKESGRHGDSLFQSNGDHSINLGDKVAD